MVSYTHFEPEGSSSGRLLYLQVWYNNNNNNNNNGGGGGGDDDDNIFNCKWAVTWWQWL
jgi:hypothetical protein